MADFLFETPDRNTSFEDNLMSSISCLCGECKLTLSENRPTLSLYCACKDCTQALRWCESRGGKAPQKLPEAFYIRSDIISVEGEKFMKAFQLRDSALSTRVYCTKCFSIIGINRPNYLNNVFWFFPNNCHANLDLSVNPCAAIYLSSYEEGIAEIPDHIPVFHNFDYPQELERFRSINGVKNTFREPTCSPNGITFENLIENLGEIENVNLKIGAIPTGYEPQF